MNRDAAIQAWLKRNQTTKFARFVEAVRERFGEIRPGEAPKGAARSLDPQLRRWHEGQDNLEGRADADTLKQAIADVLDVPPDELFPRPAKTDPSLFPIVEFEAIGPFDPRHESPCFESPFQQSRGPGVMLPEFDEPGINWFRPQQDASAKWVHAPSGSGRSFVSHWHRHHWKSHPWDRHDPRRPAPAVFVVEKLNDLRNVSWPPSTQPMIVELASADEDLGVLRELARHSVTVLAPFPCMAVEGQGPGEFAKLYAWREFAWAPGTSWRHAFVSWVGERIQRRGLDTLLDVVAFDRWADAVDPHCRIFNTPEALLGLLQVVHDHGERRLRERFGAELAREWLSVGFERYGQATVREVWLRESAPRAIEEMVAAWWSSPQLAWNDRIPEESWAALVPAEAAGSVDEARERVLRINAQLKRKVAASKKRELEAERERLLARPSSRGDVVQSLKAARLLRPREMGTLQMTPSWIPAAIASTRLKREIAHGPDVSWGRAAVDPSRQVDVDAALDTLSWQELNGAATRILASPDATSLPFVGAIEALFLAVGRKLRHGHAVPRACDAALSGVLDHQLRLLVRRIKGGLPAPRTRGGPHEPDQAGAHFLAACWDWSFARPRPADFDGTIHPWEFPGWSVPALDEVPPALRFHEGRERHGPLAEIERDGARRLAELSLQVLRRCSGDFRGGLLNAPAFLVVAAVACALDRRPSLPAVLRRVRESALPHDLAYRWISAMAEGERNAVLDAIWDTLLDEEQGVERLLLALAPVHHENLILETMNGRVSVPLSSLDEMLRARLPVEALRERIAGDGGWDDRRVAALIARVPDAYRLDLVQSLVDIACRPEASTYLVHALADVGIARPHEMVNVLMSLAENSPAAHRVVGTLWQIAPTQTLARATAAWRERGATNPWIDWMPVANLGAALAVFEAAPARPLSPSVRDWLARQLPGAGPLAERVWALMERDRTLSLSFGESSSE